MITVCACCGGAAHPATGHQWGPRTLICGICARDFIAWLKAREANMRRSIGGGQSFTEAALTSIGAQTPMNGGKR